jgi:hypothetical protein
VDAHVLGPHKHKQEDGEGITNEQTNRSRGNIDLIAVP